MALSFTGPKTVVHDQLCLGNKEVKPREAGFYTEELQSLQSRKDAWQPQPWGCRVWTLPVLCGHRPALWWDMPPSWSGVP